MARKKCYWVVQENIRCCLVIDFVCRRERLNLIKIAFISAILKKTSVEQGQWYQMCPIVFAWLWFQSKLFFQNAENSNFRKKKSILISTLKRYFLKQWCIKLTSDNRPSLDHSGTHLTSLGEFDSTVFSKMAEMKFILLKLNVSFRTKKLITTKQRILSQLSYYRIISILQK